MTAGCGECPSAFPWGLCSAPAAWPEAMATQQVGGRDQGAAEPSERRRGSHCEDKKQVRPEQVLLSGCGISGWEGQFYRHTGVVVARQGARADTTGCTLENS